MCGQCHYGDGAGSELPARSGLLRANPKFGWVAGSPVSAGGRGRHGLARVHLSADKWPKSRGQRRDLFHHEADSGGRSNDLLDHSQFSRLGHGCGSRWKCVRGPNSDSACRTRVKLRFPPFSRRMSSANLGRPFAQNVLCFSQRLEMAGFEHCVSMQPPQEGRFQIEVHPHSATVNLFGPDRNRKVQARSAGAKSPGAASPEGVDAVTAP